MVLPQFAVKALTSVLAALILLIQGSAAAGSIKEKCDTCKQIASNFDKGVKKTAKSNFGGGNTRWEEKSLGSYAYSETRLVEIMENLCESGGKDCHSMVEENEELIEQWWFKVYAKGKETELEVWLCHRRLKLCCPSGTFGEDCKECTGGKENPCRGNGKCLGDGTREGNGVCDCNAGYRGDQCEECKEGFYEESKNDTHTVCKKCDNACKSSCFDPGPQGCDDCKDGWNFVEDEGCHDIDECEADPSPCSEDQYCTNSPGSHTCSACNSVCKGCSGAGTAKCMECAENHFKDKEICRRCHIACKGGCIDGSSKGCTECADGFELNEENECLDKDECANDASLCRGEDEVCVNTQGYYRCEKCDESCVGCIGTGPSKCKECNQGYEKREDICIDIDECQTQEGQVCQGEGEVCANTAGSYQCNCQTGFTRKKDKCVKKEAKKTSSKKPSKKSSSSKKSKRGECSTCRDIVVEFYTGLEKTENWNFGGGNTKWEEKKLGSYATSETRLVEIMEGLCGDGEKKVCHTMVEHSEEYLERWWFDIFSKSKQDEDPLYGFLCIQNLQVCCPNGTYGENCDTCKGGATRPCSGNGKCDGDGTRQGKGTCNCDTGYGGDLCNECVDGYYEESHNDTHISCKACDTSCQSTCWEAGPKGCDDCKKGWKYEDEEGCVDIDECNLERTESTCGDRQFCVNNIGSFICESCHSSCDVCWGPESNQCKFCSTGYTMDDQNNCVDINECSGGDVCRDEHEKCYNSPGTYTCFCEEGYIRREEFCVPKDEDENDAPSNLDGAPVPDAPPMDIPASEKPVQPSDLTEDDKEDLVVMEGSIKQPDEDKDEL